MAFTDSIEAIPFQPGGQMATGLLAPLIRSMGHVLYCCGASAEPSYTLTIQEVQDELTHATDHLATTLEVVHNAPLSQRAKDLILHYVQAVHDAQTESAAWSADDTTANFKNLANRAAALAAFLDGECVGLRGSYPGSSL